MFQSIWLIANPFACMLFIVFFRHMLQVKSLVTLSQVLFLATDCYFYFIMVFENTLDLGDLKYCTNTCTVKLLLCPVIFLLFNKLHSQFAYHDTVKQRYMHNLCVMSSSKLQMHTTNKSVHNEGIVCPKMYLLSSLTRAHIVPRFSFHAAKKKKKKKMCKCFFPVQ